MKNYKIFDGYKTNSVGVWYFCPQKGSFEEGKPCKGFGCIKYAEGSLYTGDIYYDGENFNKKGCGQQDFTRSGIGDIIPSLGEKKYKFVGCYDYRKTDWIYGNGVLYYTDEKGAPTHFRKGFFKGLDKTGEYKGEFDYGALLDGYTKDMEFDYDENAGSLQARWEAILFDLSKAKTPYSLFIGDSFFELFGNAEVAQDNTFDKYFAEHCINAGVCGSKFSDWLEWSDNLKGIPSPEKIIINLGFNDLHMGYSITKICADFEKLTEILKGFFPKAKIYVIGVVHAPNFTNYAEKENKYNAKIQKSARKIGVNFAEWNSLIQNSGQNCFHSDAIHPGKNGYYLFARFLQDLLKG